MVQSLLLCHSLALAAFFQDPAEITSRFNRAVELQRRGDSAGAETAYRALLAQSPDYAEAHANLGAVLMRMDRYSEAVASYESALRLNPELTPVLLNLGIAHYRKGEFEKAVATFRRFLEKTTDNLQAKQLLGLSLLELGRETEAVDHLTAALEQAPNDPAVLYGLGLSYLRLRRTGVSDIVERLARVPGGEGASRLLQGQLYLGRLEFERALTELESAALLNAELPRLNYSLGLSYFKLGRNREAIASFENELRLRPKDFSTHYYLAYLHEAEGKLAAARKRIDEALSIEEDSAEANALLGKILVKQSKTTEALKPLETAVAKDPDDPEKRYLLARVYQQLGRRDDAARQFAESQRLKNEQLERDRLRLPKK